MEELVFASSIHGHISTLGSDVWSCILEYIPFKSILFLLETGDSRIKFIRRALYKLVLNGTQIRPQPLPTASFVYSWFGVRSLCISLNNIDFVNTQKDTLYLPPNLKSLEMTVPHRHCMNFISILNHSFAMNRNQYLEEITLNRHPRDKFFSFDKESSLILGSVFRNLNLSLFKCNFELNSHIIWHLPKSLLCLKLFLEETEAKFPEDTSIPPNLTTLHVYSRSTLFGDLLVSSSIIPESVTDLKIKTSDKYIWTNLPPGLCHLHVDGCKFDKKEDVINLPSSLLSLTVSECVNPNFLQYMPVKLKKLHATLGSNFDTIRDASLLPASVEDICMYRLKNDGSSWKYLSRQLKRFNDCLLVKKANVHFIGDLPASLEALYFAYIPSNEVLQSIPSRKVLKSLIIEIHFDDLSFRKDLLSVFVPSAPDDESPFPLLESLNISVAYYDLKFMDNVHLPSLSKMILNRVNFFDLTSLPKRSPLKTVEILSRGIGIYHALKHSLLCSMPTSITNLEITRGGYVKACHIPLMSLLNNLVKLNFRVSVEDFIFEKLSDLPKHLKSLVIELDADNTTTISSSLKTILQSLPKFLSHFECCSSLRDVIEINLSDCLKPFCTKKDEYLMMMNIFQLYVPPFLDEFKSYMIDPNKIFEKFSSGMKAGCATKYTHDNYPTGL